MTSVAFLNGSFAPLDSVCISPLDRGFLFGDGVYEVIPCYRGKLFRLEQHLDRLERSLAAIRIENPYSKDAWMSLFSELLENNGGGDQLLYLQITRGVAPRDHAFPQTQPTVFAMARPWKRDENPASANAITDHDNRWHRCDIKSIALLGNVLLRQAAVEEGAVENVLIRDGHVTEGAASNVFVVLDGVIKTPPKGPLILNGVTREVVLELMQDIGMVGGEFPISEKDLKNAEEIWVTSSSMELKPVVELDGVRVGGGQPGPKWMELFAAFRGLTNF